MYELIEVVEVNEKEVNKWLSDDFKCSIQNDYIIVQNKQINRSNCIKKLSKEKYVDLRSGEVYKFKKKVKSQKKKYKTQNEIRRALKKLKMMIRCNIRADKRNIFIATLTYKSNMTDSKEMYHDFDKYIKKIKYNLNEKANDLGYICIPQRQKRSAWHMHVIFINTSNTKKQIGLSKSMLKECWIHGNTHVDFVPCIYRKKIERIANYFTNSQKMCGYISELEKENVDIYNINSNNSDDISHDIVSESIDINQLYERDVKMYRTSKNLGREIVKHVGIWEFQKMIKNHKMIEKSVVDVFVYDGGVKRFVNRIMNVVYVISPNP